MQKKVLISASGTGGHLIPAQDLARDLLKKNIEILFAASDISKKLTFEKSKFNFVDISSYPFNIKKLPTFFFKILKGFFQSIFLIKKYKPDVVVGFGSYHTFPVMLAAKLLRKKIVLFDSNSSLGQVNKFFAPSAAYVAIQFPIDQEIDNKIFVKRLPWRTIDLASPNINNTDLKNLKKDFFTIFVFAGSQGSKIINKSFLDSLKKIKDKKIQVIHLIGKGETLKEIENTYKNLKDRKSTRLNSSHIPLSRMPSSA